MLSEVPMARGYADDSPALEKWVQRVNDLMKVVYQHGRVQRKAEKAKAQAGLTGTDPKVRCAEALEGILAFLKETVSARFRFGARLTLSVREGGP